MRPSTKHGLEKKFKPWRKGKASSDKASGKSSGSASGNGSVKRPTNASLKNRLRGQKRLLAKLQQNDGDAVKNKETIDGVQQSMKQLERDIAAYETSELEKKNATKWVPLIIVSHMMCISTYTNNSLLFYLWSNTLWTDTTKWNSSRGKN